MMQKTMITSLNIAGFDTRLHNVSERSLINLPLNVALRFNFSEGEFKGQRLCFLSAKEGVAALSPARCRKIAQQISGILEIPIVFVFDSLPYYQRQRFIEQNVYFVVSGKFANLPNIFINAIDSKVSKKRSGKLSPVAQYVLLYYLQHPDCDFEFIKDIVNATPFSYLQISRAIVDIEHFGLCLSRVSGKTKRIYFKDEKRLLWEKALPYLRNPVEKVRFTDEQLSIKGVMAGINALAHYTSINQVSQSAMALEKKQFETLLDVIPNNPIEGALRIEEWIYPPAITDNGYADPLSLCLSLRDSSNPRIEDALEQLIENMKW